MKSSARHEEHGSQNHHFDRLIAKDIIANPKTTFLRGLKIS